VPRWLPVLGLIGAVLLVATWFAVLIGFIGAVSPAAAVATVPIAVWEFSLGIYLTFWGFKASPITAGL
jgi:peptidoglycan/LPS O-acetylase OafA/YrhL